MLVAADENLALQTALLRAYKMSIECRYSMQFRQHVLPSFLLVYFENWVSRDIFEWYCNPLKSSAHVSFL